MAVAITQKQRLLTIETSLGTDVLLVQGFNATEHLSGLFYLNIELMAERSKADQVKPESLLGTLATLTVALDDDFSGGKMRIFNGVVKKFSLGSQDERFCYYSMQLVPWSWLLSQKADCRVFQDLSALDIIKKIFDDIKGKFSSLVKYKDATTKSYTKLDYCVQYRESDLNFVSRLMEEEGIFYFFKHTKSGHELVLADSAEACEACEHQSEVRFAPEGGVDEREKDVVLSWNSQQEIHPGKHVLRDYHFQMPGKLLEVNETTKKAVGESSKLEVYDYPGEYALRFNKPDERLGDVEKEGQALIKPRIEAEDAAVPETAGTSTVRTFVTGATFKLQK
ncbi:MAG TPA: type VI secretion system tip protein TssI/VgrG, partial [Nitrososphaera sp.]|nr:type VI secretion system tip protein TssI/VgrG [Nitrososphaera sp.]